VAELFKPRGLKAQPLGRAVRRPLFGTSKLFASYLQSIEGEPCYPAAAHCPARRMKNESCHINPP